jgi:ribulose-phosphate 3-epimerase
MNDPTFAIALDALDPLDLGAGVLAAKEAGCVEVAADVSDGTMGLPVGGGTTLLAALQAQGALPVCARIRSRRPETLLPSVLATGCATVVLPVETGVHLNRALATIREAGRSPGLSIEPMTSLTALDYLLEQADRVVLSPMEPGAAAPPGSYAERIGILKQYLVSLKLRNMLLQAGPGLNPHYAALASAAGAARITLGQGLPSDTAGLAEGIETWVRQFRAKAAVL